MDVRHKLILLILLSFMTRVGYSQPWYFNEIYNPNNTWAGGLSIIGTNNGYFGCAISSDSISGYYYNTCTFLLNPMGELISWKNFGQDGFDFYPGYYGSLISAPDSCYAVFGSQHSLYSGLSNGIFYKFNAEGDTIFSKSFFSETYNMLIGRACTNTLDGGYSLLGEVSVGTDYSDLILIKTDEEANEIWRQQYGTSVDDWGVSIIQTIDSGYALGGWAYTPGQEESGDPVVIKTDSLGNFEWSINLGGPYKDDKAMLCLTQDSCIIVLTAYADSMYNPEYAFARINLIKIDLEGNTIWNKKYGTSKPVNFISNIILLENGDMMASGYSKYSPYLYRAGWLFRINSNGDSIWYRDYFYYPEDTNFGTNFLYDVSLAGDHGLVAIGQAYNLFPPDNTQKMWVLKVDSVGCEIENCWVGVDEQEEQGGGEAGERGGMEVWPNPAREVLSIKVLDLSSGIHYYISIYDIFGRLSPIPGTSPTRGKGEEIGWTVDVSILPPGIYLAVVKEGQVMKASAKFVVVR